MQKCCSGASSVWYSSELAVGSRATIHIKLGHTRVQRSLGLMVSVAITKNTLRTLCLLAVLQRLVRWIFDAKGQIEI